MRRFIATALVLAPLALVGCSNGLVPLHAMSAVFVHYGPQTGTGVAPPSALHVTDPERAEALALAFDQLPRPPRGPVSCPAGNGQHEDVTFTYNDKPTVLIRIGSCLDVSRIVGGVSVGDRWLANPLFGIINQMIDQATPTSTTTAQ